jgi:hypothetical protein
MVAFLFKKKENQAALELSIFIPSGMTKLQEMPGGININSITA